MKDKDQKRGAYKKYEVTRLNDPDGKQKECEYYVLDWKHDKFTIPAMIAYANACEKEYPLLARDINKQISEAIKKAEGIPDSLIGMDRAYTENEMKNSQR